MSPARTVVLDNEAVQALIDPAGAKHRRVLAVVEAVAARNLRLAGSVRLAVPTAVRVEAGWDRASARAAPINRLRLDDMALDAPAADRAARARSALGISVADAHLGAVLAVTPAPHAVLTSDVADMRRITGHLGIDATLMVV